MPQELRVRRESWPLARPFRISRGVKTTADVVVVEIISADGRALGRGESVPYARYGESIESVISQIEAMRASLSGATCREELLSRISPGSARNAIDCALWDLEAQSSSAGVAGMLRESPITAVTTAFTIGLDSPEAMARAAKAIASAALVKVKVDAINPVAQIRAVREACPESEIIVDPNESWNEDILRHLQVFLVECRVALLEQPLPAGEERTMSGFIPSVPICADESCHTAADLPKLMGYFQYVNIKLDKTGGLTAALELATRAHQAGFGIMVGCMICTSLSIAPALHVARHARFLDIDGPLWLLRDRAGGIRVENGRVLPPKRGFWGEMRHSDAAF